MPPKAETNVAKYLQQREIGGKKQLHADTHAMITIAEFQRQYEARRNAPGYVAPQPAPGFQVLGEMKKGGMINKTGVYKLHKGEMVVPASKVKKVMKKK